MYFLVEILCQSRCKQQEKTISNFWRSQKVLMSWHKHYKGRIHHFLCSWPDDSIMQYRILQKILVAQISGRGFGRVRSTARQELSPLLTLRKASNHTKKWYIVKTGLTSCCHSGQWSSPNLSQAKLYAVNPQLLPGYFTFILFCSDISGTGQHPYTTTESWIQERFWYSTNKNTKQQGNHRWDKIIHTIPVLQS